MLDVALRLFAQTHHPMPPVSRDPLIKLSLVKLVLRVPLLLRGIFWVYDEELLLLFRLKVDAELAFFNEFDFCTFVAMCFVTRGPWLDLWSFASFE